MSKRFKPVKSATYFQVKVFSQLWTMPYALSWLSSFAPYDLNSFETNFPTLCECLKGPYST